jgi:glyceraldehyde 3-phosphate dehydrogenase
VEGSVATRVGINGFGRIGRNVWRAIRAQYPDLEVVAVNDLADPKTLAQLLAYDSVLGRLDVPVTCDAETITAGGRSMRVCAERDPAALPWGELGVDVVIESTGRFTNAQDARVHISSGATRVVISAPAKGEDLTVVMGVNDHAYDGTQTVLSNASCTTNCVAPMAKVLHDTFGIVRGFMTTVHAYTGDQVLLDGIHSDPRRARAAALNIIPTTTGAATATALVLPELAGRLDGVSLRVPVPTGSITDLVCVLERAPSGRDEVNAAFRAAAETGLKGYLEYSEAPLVSTDIVGSPNSCTFDSLLTMANGPHVKVLGWYDNEWGYSCRLADLVRLVGAPRR